MLAKYIIRNVARRNGKTATFMPKPLFGDNGSGMHTHFSLWKGEAPLLAGNGYAGLSDLGMYAIGGLLKHAPALCAFANPTTNSYKRLSTGFEAPTKLVVQPPQPRGGHPRSRSTARARGAGGSSTAAPTARPTPTCSSRRC